MWLDISLVLKVLHVLFVFIKYAETNGIDNYTRQGLLHKLLFVNKSGSNKSVYDPTISPNFEDDIPTAVTIQIYLQNIYSLSEASMDFSVDLILRQKWTDRRLQYNNMSSLDFIELDNKLMKSVWKEMCQFNVPFNPELTEFCLFRQVPDTYFVNEKHANVHDVTVPNKMMHLYRNGTVLYSMRLSLTLSCSMRLQKYPLDEQRCPIILESYAYTIGNVVFMWEDFNPVSIQRNVTMPQFEPRIGDWGNDCETDYNQSMFSCLWTQIYLPRKVGYYIVQVFVPSVLIVVLSWVSFWVDHDAVPARVSLGVLTVLTMTTQSSGSRQSLPQVSYVKAIDVWMFTCLLFVFVALLEYSYLNVIVRRHNKIRRSVSSVSAKEPLELNTLPIRSTEEEHVIQNTIEAISNESGTLLLQKSASARNMQHWVKARRIDKVSRVVFPLSFICFNIVFWTYYIFAPNPN